MNQYIAHKRKEDNAVQSVEEHLMQTAKLAGEFGKVFGCENSAYICGLLHDVGKYSDDFLIRIKEDGPKCDHATAGAQLLEKMNPFLGKWFAYTILGHHGGMPDYVNANTEGTYCGRMIKQVPDYTFYGQIFNDEQFVIKEPPKLKPDTDWGFKISFLIRMVYSCLVDADFLDTEKFMQTNTIDRCNKVDFVLMNHKLNKVIASFKQDTVVNQYRKKILDSCIDAASGDMGMFQLTVPTGGGKTIASAAFALNHLLQNQDKLRRIIYVIPYSSIIEQNAKVFADIFGRDVILEHHSNYDFESTEDDFNCKKKLASENWDMPFIVSTNVQFFESLFSNKPSKCRKLHNIAGSVIIFDEVQALPSNYMAPCMRAVEELVREYNCSAVLCSATQPKLDSFFHYGMPLVEMCYEPDRIFKALKRARAVHLTECSMFEIAERVNKAEQVLVVVNKRDTTKKLYEKLKKMNNKNVYHLSTYMCPEHRKKVIEIIRKKLKDGESCKVISTNLIEAGVDLDFQEVYRELAGIDSIVQAAGRANREGKREQIGEVYIFSFTEKEYRVSTANPFGQYLDKCVKNAKRILDKYEDIFQTQAIEEYFTYLYQDMIDQEFDGKGLVKRINEFYFNGEFRFYFKEIADKFKLIDEETYPVFIPYDEVAKNEIVRLSEKYYIPTRKDIRANQKYMVNVRKYEYETLFRNGRIMKITDGLAVLINEKEYKKEDTGLEMETELGIGLFI